MKVLVEINLTAAFESLNWSTAYSSRWQYGELAGGCPSPQALPRAFFALRGKRHWRAPQSSAVRETAAELSSFRDTRSAGRAD